MAMLLSIPKSPHKNINPKSTDNIYNKTGWQKIPPPPQSRRWEQITNNHKTFMVWEGAKGNRVSDRSENRDSQNSKCKLTRRSMSTEATSGRVSALYNSDYVQGVHGEAWSWCYLAPMNSWNWSFTKGVTIKIKLLGVKSKSSTVSIINKKERECQNKSEEDSKA